MIMNMGIPFRQYESQDSDGVVEEMASELSDITDHIFISTIFTVLLIISMYYINL